MLIAVSALGATNATIFTGARSATLSVSTRSSPLGSGAKAETPVRALGAQGTIALFLVLLSPHPESFETWSTAAGLLFFLLLTGLSLFVLRARSGVARPFQCPYTP